MAGVGIDDQLSVREVLLQDERVDGVDDQVPVAVHDERRLVEASVVMVDSVAQSRSMKR